MTTDTDNQPSHRPLREGDVIQDGDIVSRLAGASWEPVPRSWIGEAWTDEISYPMRRPVKD